MKQQADQALKEGNSSAAVSLWQQTLAVDSNDPEALIYAASPDGHTYMKDWQGCFTKNICRSTN